MNTLILESEDNVWVRLVGRIPSSFIDFLRYGIKPATYRRWEPAKKSWYVHWQRLPMVAHAARVHFDAVDWSRLSDQLQMHIASTKSVGNTPSASKATPYTLLHVTEDAPMAVIRAAYKALAVIHHPDRGGDTAKMAEITTAYDNIRLLRSSRDD